MVGATPDHDPNAVESPDPYALREAHWSLLRTADDAYAAMPLPDPPRLPYIVAAQVHTTLAQAAAAALNDGCGGTDGDIRREWLTATLPVGGER